MTWRSQFLITTMIRHPQVKAYHLKPQTLKHVEILKVSDKPTYDIVGKVFTWSSQFLISTIVGHPQVKPYHLKPPNLKHVETKMFQINLHMIHHWKRLDLEITDFTYHDDPTPSCESVLSQTSNP